MPNLTYEFAEAPHFYEILDSSIKHSNVTIAFNKEQPDLDSPLWKRLKKCSGWSEVEREFEKAARGADSPLAHILSPKALVKAHALSPGAVILGVTAILAVWSIVIYAVYKGRAVKVKGSAGNKSGEIVISGGDPAAGDPATAW